MRKFFITLTIMMLPACAMADGKGDIQAVLDQWLAKYAAGDAAGVAALYTEDTIILLPDGSRMDGRAAVQAFQEESMAAGITYDNVDMVDFGMDGNLAWHTGVFLAEVPLEGDDVFEAAGTYAIVWRKDADGAWRIHMDTWNDAAGEE
ncbi:MAG: SgcJ/EcaC family oxidoreductase [Alphaproteobacteria bacterium]|jgi:uncharacterized protein (TIGR02246 family)|nr:SgcJ/EcaC family oxidoreductase [Alphaproteobacteria bacterium]